MLHPKIALPCRKPDKISETQRKQEYFNQMMQSCVNANLSRCMGQGIRVARGKGPQWQHQHLSCSKSAPGASAFLLSTLNCLHCPKGTNRILVGQFTCMKSCIFRSSIVFLTDFPSVKLGWPPNHCLAPLPHCFYEPKLASRKITEFSCYSLLSSSIFA